MTALLPEVSADKVSKIYGRHRAVSKVSVTVRSGEVLALLGPNGSGKTTLLNLFSTLSRPTSGAMRFGALPPERASDARRAIGLVSHAPLSYGDLTARENVAFFARLYRRPDPALEAEAMLARFDLSDAIDRPVATFSRGMLQRLGLARALIGQPELVLLDEPFTGLDRRSKAHVVSEVDRLRSAGTAVLMISHDLGIAAELADSAAIMLRGRLADLHHGRQDPEGLRQRYVAITEPEAAR